MDGPAWGGLGGECDELEWLECDELEGLESDELEGLECDELECVEDDERSFPILRIWDRKEWILESIES